MFPDICWDIEKGKVLQEFQHWSDQGLYKVEFEITITNLGSGWTSIFHFSANGDARRYGDRIPAIFINSHGYFHICSAINGNANYCKNIDFKLGKKYQMTITQFKASGKYWYEIIIDGESKFKIENGIPWRWSSFSSVKLYASDPWYNSFSSDLGSICNVKIQQDDE